MFILVYKIAINSIWPDLIILRWPGIKRPTEKQLRHDAAQRPHVNSFAERQPQDYFGRSVVSGLQVGVAHSFAYMRRATKVDHFHSEIVNKFFSTEHNKTSNIQREYSGYLPVGLSHRIHQHDIFWLQVSMNESKLLQL